MIVQSEVPTAASDDVSDSELRAPGFKHDSRYHV